ncbi:hypothetical protein L1765_11055 [Microaerobacter geothermalis]|uniref:hypothetical protein n=1 Tax=Microaerobacter geothermalis TaxID=674972 RepID=UPI001F40F944|nr:hypothetical protein [Microaerobacter geothermalis]MCF6094501.1 hypothetical protein [Microaerobacter geothermalis]
MKNFKENLILLLVFVGLASGFLFVVDSQPIAQSDWAPVEPPVSDDWNTYGANNQRTRTVSDFQLQPPLQFKAKLDIGWSVSQTIAVGDYFYAVAAVPDTNNFFELPRGTYFYRIPVSAGEFKPGDDKAAYKQDIIQKGARATWLGDYAKTYSHPTWSPENNVFYIGYNSGNASEVLAVSADLSEILGSYSVGEEIVGAPHAFPGDLVVVGAFDAKIHAIKGLKTKNQTGEGYYRTYSLDDTYSNAEISSSTSEVSVNPNRFVVTLNYRGSSRAGLVGMFEVTDPGGNEKPIISRVWPNDFKADTGVPTNAVYEDNGIYFSDKNGTFYRLWPSDGSLIWKKSYGYMTLVNNSPAMGETNIYFPVRRPGMLIGLKKEDGSLVFKAGSGKDKNGNPVDPDISTGNDVANDATVWKASDGRAFVFYGDTKGQLIFLDYDGNRTEVAFDWTTNTLTRSSVKATSDGSVPGDWQVQGQGLATEMMLAKNHLAFGVNKGDTGELWLYTVGKYVNLSLSLDGTNPLGRIYPGSSVKVNVLVYNRTDANEPFDTVLKYQFGDNPPVEQRVTIYPLREYPYGQPLSVTFDNMPRNEVPYTIEINPYRNEPEEINYADNVITGKLYPQIPNLIISDLQMSANPPKQGEDLSLAVNITNERGWDGNITTDLVWRINGVEAGRREGIVVPYDSTTTVDGIIINSNQKKLNIEFEVNPSRDKPSGERKWEDNLLQQTIYFTDDVDLYVKSVEGGTYQQDETVVTKVLVGSAGFTFEPKEAKVRLLLNGQELGSRTVTLDPGEERTLYFTWTAQKTMSGGSLVASINFPPEFPEINYGNNQMSAGVDIQVVLSETDCDPNDVYNQGLVKKETRTHTRTETHTDADGNRYTEEHEYTRTHRYYETLDVSIINVTPKETKAGFGFTFEVRTEYQDDTNTYDGPTRVVAYFPTEDNFVGKEVELEPLNPVGSWVNTWVLPEIYIEEWSGNLFYKKMDVNRDFGDKLLDGGRKWYTPFSYPDGQYRIKVIAYNAGKNDLSDCDEDYVTIKGSPFDDYVNRSILPYHPFPAGVGSNWQGKEWIIEDTVDWYNSDQYHNPEDVPLDYPRKIFWVDDEMLEKIREYNRSVPLDGSPTMIDDLGIPYREN